jgi:hypothetical protein
MSTSKSELKVVEYRARAEAAASAAAACQLDRQREQHEASAAVWNQMADAEERRARERAVHLAPAAPVEGVQ